ncbi:MAG: ROK family protein [Pirellulaceae bacterium]
MHPRPRETKLAGKKNRILNEVFRSESCSRIDLARRLNINATMVGNYVDEFLRDGLLIEDEPGSSRPGRRPVPLRPNQQHGCFLGLDFEALRARAVLCDFAGEVLHQREIPFRSGIRRESVLKQIVALARRLADQADRPLMSVGVAAPGQVDCLSGRVLHYRLLPDFSEVPLRERFERAFDVPVFVEDNIRSVAFGELLRGAGRGSRDFVCLAVRSGVGLGIVIDGKLYSGTNAMAGEVGYTVFPTESGPRTMTDIASAKGFVEATMRVLRSRQNTTAQRRLIERGDDVSLADIVSAAEAGDNVLREQLERLGTHLGMIVANLANLFAPEKIVLSGEVPDCSTIVRHRMERTFRQFALPQILKTAYLENGTLGAFAGALGAAYLGFAKTFPEDEETLIRQAKENAKLVG